MNVRFQSWLLSSFCFSGIVNCRCSLCRGKPHFALLAALLVAGGVCFSESTKGNQGGLADMGAVST